MASPQRQIGFCGKTTARQAKSVRPIIRLCYRKGLNNRVIGTTGSIRVDAAEGDKDCPHTIYDLKTGNAYLTDARTRQLREHLPIGNAVDIREVRP